MKAISILFILIGCASYQLEDTLRKPLLALSEPMRQCYLKSNTYKKKERISFKLQFVVNTDGSTQDRQLVEKTANDKEMEECILNVAKDLKYESREDMTLTVKQLFNFYP